MGSMGMGPPAMDATSTMYPLLRNCIAAGSVRSVHAAICEMHAAQWTQVVCPPRG